MPKKENPLNQHYGKGKDRIEMDAGAYYCISNGKFYGKLEKDAKGVEKYKGGISVTKGDTVKLTAEQATGLAECVITEKVAKQFQDKSAKGMTTKSFIGTDD